jgi:hypothetical protein
MTVSIVWVRTVNNCEELWFASDSRLSGGGTVIDYCPKILLLPRSDCAICFAGFTGTAYAIMQQLSLAIGAYEPAFKRSMDIKELKSHALNIFNSMSSAIKTDIPELKDPDASFIFGGYSWVHKSFEIWKIKYNLKTRSFEALPSQFIGINTSKNECAFASKRYKNDSFYRLGKMSFGGDQGGEAKRRLKELITNRIVSGIKVEKLDMEPFEVLRDMLRDKEKSYTIGGAPQVAKIYQYMHSMPVSVFWPDKASNQLTLLGRPLLKYENIQPWALDPDTLKTSNPNTK